VADVEDALDLARELRLVPVDGLGRVVGEPVRRSLGRARFGGGSQRIALAMVIAFAPGIALTLR